jgi:hypothetical protein
MDGSAHASLGPAGGEATTVNENASRKKFSIRSDSIGSPQQDHHHANTHVPNVDSLTYIDDESEAWRAHAATEYYTHRGRFWNLGKHRTMERYVLIAAIGIFQAFTAYFTNIVSKTFIEASSYISDCILCCYYYILYYLILT